MRNETLDRAVARLDPCHREVLTLRELDRLSYEEISSLLEIAALAVGALISRARLRLRDEMRGGALATIATRSHYCDRALALVAARTDGELRDEDERDWLLAHLACCPSCRIREEAMAEAGLLYRVWAQARSRPAEPSAAR
jgi:hypothetical protein